MAKIITGRFSRSSSGNSELSDEQKEADKASIAQKQEEKKADLSAMGSRFERDSSGSRPFSAEQQAANTAAIEQKKQETAANTSRALSELGSRFSRSGTDTFKPGTTVYKNGKAYLASDRNTPVQGSYYDIGEAVNSIWSQAEGYGAGDAVSKYSGKTIFGSEAEAQSALDKYLEQVNTGLTEWGKTQTSYDISEAIASIWSQVTDYGASGSVSQYSGETTFKSESEAQSALDKYLSSVNSSLTAWSESQPVTIYDTLGRTYDISSSQYKQLLEAQSKASSYDNYYVLPEEVANSQADWWINANGLFEWAPVTAGDKAELALENKQRKQLGQSEKTTLTAGATWSDEFTKNWYSTGGGNRGTGETGVKIKSSSGDIIQTFDYDSINRAVTGSGDVKLAALKESSSVNASASAITNTAQQQKATVIEKAVASMVETPVVSEKKTDVSAMFGAGFIYGAKAEAITAIASEFVNPTETITLDVTDTALKAAQAKGAKVSKDAATGTIIYTDEKSKKIYEAEYGKAASDYSAQWSAALNLSPEKIETQEKVDAGMFGALKLGWAAGTGKQVNMEGWESRSVELSGFSQKLIDVADSVTKKYDETQESIFGNLGVAGDFLTGVTNIPQMLIEGGLIVPAGLESTAKNPTAAADYFLAGTGAMFGSIYTKAKGNPAELAGELVGAVALGKVSAKVAAAGKTAKNSVYSVKELKVNKPVTASRGVTVSETANPFGKLNIAEQRAVAVVERGMKATESENLFGDVTAKVSKLPGSKELATDGVTRANKFIDQAVDKLGSGNTNAVEKVNAVFETGTTATKKVDKAAAGAERGRQILERSRQESRGGGGIEIRSGNQILLMKTPETKVLPEASLSKVAEKALSKNELQIQTKYKSGKMPRDIATDILRDLNKSDAEIENILGKEKVEVKPLEGKQTNTEAIIEKATSPASKVISRPSSFFGEIAFLSTAAEAKTTQTEASQKPVQNIRQAQAVKSLDIMAKNSPGIDAMLRSGETQVPKTKQSQKKRMGQRDSLIIAALEVPAVPYVSPEAGITATLPGIKVSPAQAFKNLSGIFNPSIPTIRQKVSPVQGEIYQPVVPIISISEATGTTTNVVPKLSTFLAVDVPQSRNRKPPLSSEEDGKNRGGAPKSSRYGRKKRTYSNAFGSFTAFNMAMKKAGQSIERQSKRDERTGKQTNIKKFTGKW